MSSAFAGLIASLGLALVVTALTLPKRQTPAVIDAVTHGTGYLEETSLGYQPSFN